MPTCTCNGTNPDCCFCGGWGWIGDQVRPVPQAAPHVVQPAPQAAPRSRSGKLKPTRIIFEPVDSDLRLVKPNKVAPKPQPKAGQRVPTQRAPIKPRPKRCPVCNQAQPSLENHLMMVHKIFETLAKEIAQGRAEYTGKRR